MCCSRRRLLAAAAWLILAAAAWLPAAAAPAPGDDFWFTPQAVYDPGGRRDPFVQPPAGLQRNVLSQVDIQSLRLTGVISHPTRSVALFTTLNGPRFGYLLKDGRLYRENHQVIPGVSGVVISREEVTLKQGDTKMTFKLR